MVELWLNFKDENGEPKRILVGQEKFTIGRTPENDLAVPYNNISRQHAEIEYIDETFVISDCGSSNGSSINDQNFHNPVVLKNGDSLNLGGWLEIEVEITGDNENAKTGDAEPGATALPAGSNGAGNEDLPVSTPAPAAGSTTANASVSSGSSSSFGWMLLAPVMVIFVLLIGGGILLISGAIGPGKSNTLAKKENGISPTEEESETPKPEKSETPEPKTSPTTSSSIQTPSTSPGNSASTPEVSPTSTTNTGSTGTPTTSPISNDGEKVKTSSASLLRRIATKDPNAFLTTQQTNFITDKIVPFKGSSALAENLKDAKKNSSKIGELAKSKNLTPQFLLVATLTELGSQHGDVMAKATEISGILAELTQVLGNELADDSLLVIAAYDQGKAGKNDELLGTITKLSNEFPNSRVRSVWFLREKNKLSEPQFQKVLRFLAVGTIVQNPKDFNVNADAIVF